MNKDELELYIKKAYENVFKKLAENPEEMLNLSDLQDKYNNLLKEKIELKEQIKKQKEVIDKAMEYINKNLIVVSILNGIETFGLNSYTFDYKKLLDILKEVE